MTLNFEDLAERLQEIMKELFDDNLDSGAYIDEWGCFINCDVLEDRAKHILLIEIQDAISDEFTARRFSNDESYFMGLISSLVPNHFFSELESEAKEFHRELKAYESDILAYHGLSQSDFI